MPTLIKVCNKLCNVIILLYSTLVYKHQGYTSLVGRLTEQSMQKAIDEIKERPDYSTKGEVCESY